MQYEDFEQHFKPIKNHLNPNSSIDGTVFETYGEELAFVLEQDVHNIWTVIVNDDNPYDNFVDNFQCDCNAQEEVCSCGKAQSEAEAQGLEPIWYISKGFRTVNRMGYIITKEKWNVETEDDVEY